MGQKREKEAESLSVLPHFFAFLPVWMVFFWTPQKFQCDSLAGRWRGIQIRCMAVGCWAAEIFEECLLRQPFVGEIEGKVKASRLATLQKSARAPLPSGACN